MRIPRRVLLLTLLGVLTASVAWSATTPGRIRVEGEPGVKLRFRASGNGNVSLVSAAEIYGRDSAGVDVLAPAVFAIRPGGAYYVRFDAVDSTATILTSAEGGLRFGFVSLGSRYTGQSVVCGSSAGSSVRSVPRNNSVTDHSCPD